MLFLGERKARVVTPNHFYTQTTAGHGFEDRAAIPRHLLTGHNLKSGILISQQDRLDDQLRRLPAFSVQALRGLMAMRFQKTDGSRVDQHLSLSFTRIIPHYTHCTCQFTWWFFIKELCPSTRSSPLLLISP